MNAPTAACRTEDPELFFPSNTAGPRRINAAKDVCNSGCPVFDACLSYALRNKVEGVWAATTEKERDALRRKHSIKAAPIDFGVTRAAIYGRSAE